jgi:hypothetical protein
MKQGTRVKHKLTGIEMTIKKNYGNVASCYLDEKDYFPLHDKSNEMIKTQVCLLENIEFLQSNESQLTLFT